MKDQKKTWFENHPKITLSIFLFISFSILLLLFEYLLSLKVEDHWAKGAIRNNRNIILYEYSPNINISVYPTSTYINYVNAKNLKQKKYKFRTDSSGYIMPSKIHKNPDLTIGFLGGSTTECMFVSEHIRFPYLACKILEDSLNIKINSINAGVSGINSMSGMNILMNKLIPEKMNYLVIMYNMNDLVTFIHTGSYWNTSKRSLISQERNDMVSKIKKFANKLFPNIYNLLKSLKGKQLDDEWDEYRNEKLKINSELISQYYEKSIKSLIEICKNWDIIPVLMTQPNRLGLNKPSSEFFGDKGNINYKDFTSLYYNLNNTIRELSMKNETILIDLESNIPKDTTHIYDFVHMNDCGSKSAAIEIAGVLNDHILSSEFNK